MALRGMISFGGRDWELQSTYTTIASTDSASRDSVEIMLAQFALHVAFLIFPGRKPGQIGEWGALGWKLATSSFDYSDRLARDLEK
jgi:hypothetical protein